jgi:hypothetical protein
MKLKAILSLVAFLLILSPLAFSQSRETGAIVGKVTDEENNPLPGVTVTATIDTCIINVLFEAQKKRRMF